MNFGLFLDLDGVLTEKAVNLQYAAMLGVESQLLSLEDNYRNGLINNAQYNDVFIPLFVEAGFTQRFAQDRFSKIELSQFAAELLQVNLPNVFLVTSSPSYFVQQFARKFNIPEQNVICSEYTFDVDGKLDKCASPCGVVDKASFVERRMQKFDLSMGVGDSPEQDGKFMGHCSVGILMGGERNSYLHATDLYAVHDLIVLIHRLIKRRSEKHLLSSETSMILDQSPLEKNVFIMTSFRPDARNTAAISAIKDELLAHGLRGWTADELDVGDDLWENVRTFMHACKYGVAILTADEILEADAVKIRKDVYNPNVLVEAGFMLGQAKKVLILKDDRISLPTDWLGKLAHPFNLANPAEQIRSSVRKWVRSKAI